MCDITMKKSFATIKLPNLYRRNSKNKPKQSPQKEQSGNLNGRSYIRQKDIALCKDFIRKNSLLIFLWIILLAGLITGTFCAKTASDSLLKNLNFLFNSNFNNRMSQPLIATFSTSIASSFIFVLLTMLMGTSIWGVFLVPSASFFKGFGLGVSSGFMYVAFSFKGILFNLIVVLPGMFISSMALIIAGREAIKFSSLLLKTQTKRQRMPEIKSYFLSNSKVFILIAISALVDTLLSWCFSSIFVF
jgi:stage II sporulation protein M